MSTVIKLGGNQEFYFGYVKFKIYCETFWWRCQGRKVWSCKEGSRLETLKGPAQKICQAKGKNGGLHTVWCVCV